MYLRMCGCPRCHATLLIFMECRDEHFPCALLNSCHTMFPVSYTVDVTSCLFPCWEFSFDIHSVWKLLAAVHLSHLPSGFVFAGELQKFQREAEEAKEYARERKSSYVHELINVRDNMEASNHKWAHMIMTLQNCSCALGNCPYIDLNQGGRMYLLRLFLCSHVSDCVGIHDSMPWWCKMHDMHSQITPQFLEGFSKLRCVLYTTESFTCILSMVLNSSCIHIKALDR